MGRINYVCATCSETFTRRYNGRRHRLKVHGGRSEIVRLVEYLVGRQSGKYAPSNPFWYSDKQKLQAQLCDSYTASNIQVQSTYTPLQRTYTASRPTFTAADEQQPYSERMIKFKVLEGLLYKHLSHLGQNPQTILRNILAYSTSRADDSFIDEKLEWLHRLR